MKDNVIISLSDPKQSRQKSVTNDADSPIMIRQNDEFTSALSISAVARNQGGTYKCIVENDAAKETYSALLRVNGNVHSIKRETRIIFSLNSSLFTLHAACLFFIFLHELPLFV